MIPRKIRRIAVALVLAALIFGAELEWLAPRVGAAVQAWAHRSGADMTAMRVWFAPILLDLAALVVFAVVAVWAAIFGARRLIPAGPAAKGDNE